MAKTFEKKLTFSPTTYPGNDISLQKVFGYPPDNLEPRTNEMIKKSMPVVKFFPSKPQFQRGLDLFHIKSSWDEYRDLLKENQYVTNNQKGDGIQLAFLADNFPTDSFTNEYGENFLQKFTSMASEGASSISQMLGAESASGAFNTLQKDLAKSDNAIPQGIASMMKMFGGAAGATKKALGEIPGIGKSTASGINLIDRLAAGARIDFPMVWKSSGFQPSYSMTVRLYNPFPQSEEATRRFIVGPLVAIMLMGVPRAADSSTYTWPFLHKIECPGLFVLNPGFISNITVIKGGDQQQISFNQRLGIVDVRIDVGSLYSSMLGGSSKITSARPMVRDYAKTLIGEKFVNTRVEDNENLSSFDGQKVTSNRDEGTTEFGENAFGSNVNVGTGRQVGHTNRGRGISPKRSARSSDSSEGYKSRVTAAATEVYDELKDLSPFN